MLLVLTVEMIDLVADRCKSYGYVCVKLVDFSLLNGHSL